MIQRPSPATNRLRPLLLLSACLFLAPAPARARTRRGPAVARRPWSRRCSWRPGRGTTASRRWARPAPANPWPITAKVSETVGKVHFESGDVVKAGQVLVTLSAQAQAAGIERSRRGISGRADSAGSAEGAGRSATGRGQPDGCPARDRAMPPSARLDQMRAQVGDRVISAPFDGVLGLRHGQRRLAGHAGNGDHDARRRVHDPAGFLRARTPTRDAGRRPAGRGDQRRISGRDSSMVRISLDRLARGSGNPLAGRAGRHSTTRRASCAPACCCGCNCSSRRGPCCRCPSSACSRLASRPSCSGLAASARSTRCR